MVCIQGYSGVAIVNIGMVINQVLAVVSSIVVGVAVARHLGSLEFYELAKLTSYFMLISVFFRFGFEYRVLESFKLKAQFTVVGLPRIFLVVSFILCGAALGSLAIFGPSLLTFGLAVIPCALMPVLNTTFAVNKRSNTVSMLSIPLTILFAFARVASIKMGYALDIFLSIFVIEIVVSCLLMTSATCLFEQGKKLSIVTTSGLSKLLWPAAVTILSLLGLKAPLLLGEYMLAEHELGGFALSLRVLESIIIITGALTTSRFFKFSKLLDGKLDMALIRETRIISLGLFFCLVGICLLPMSIYLLVVGTEYEMAITNIKILAVVLPVCFCWNMADKVMIVKDIRLVVFRQVVLFTMITVLYLIAEEMAISSSIVLCFLLIGAYLFSYIFLDFLIPALWRSRDYKIKSYFP